MYMADKASDDGSGIWVSKKNMAADLEMAIRTLQTNVRDMGWHSRGVVHSAGCPMYMFVAALLGIRTNQSELHLW